MKLALRLGWRFGWVGLLCGLAACQMATVATPSPTWMMTVTPLPPTVTATVTFTPSLTPTVTLTPTETITATPTPSREVVLAAVGDMMLARTIGNRLQSQGGEVIFGKVSHLLQAADLAVGNLECAIGLRGEPQPKSYRFLAPPVAALALSQAGFDVLSLANNHILDYGLEGFEDTLRYLGVQGIWTVGAGWNADQARAPLILERNGLRVAFLAYVDVPVESRSKFNTRTWEAAAEKAGVAWLHTSHVAEDVAAARQEADVVVVLFHNGWENRSEPNDFQRLQARTAIDAGAALVIGSHPHVLQEVEEYHGGLILYSLGNFVFDDFVMPANYSVIFSIRLTPAGVAGYSWEGVVLEDGIPRLADEVETARIRKILLRNP